MKEKIKFHTKSYTIQGLDKWVPSGSITENSNGKIVVTGVSFPDKRFETKSEADKYMDNYFKEKGYHRD